MLLTLACLKRYFRAVLSIYQEVHDLDILTSTRTRLKSLTIPLTEKIKDQEDNNKTKIAGLWGFRQSKHGAICSINGICWWEEINFSYHVDHWNSYSAQKQQLYIRNCFGLQEVGWGLLPVTHLYIWSFINDYLYGLII